MPVFLSFKKNIDSLIAAIAGFTIIFLFTRHGGIGVEPDSVVYITTAQNLRDTGRLTEFTGQPLVDFPAFYPFFLSGFILITGLKPLVFMPILNAFLFAFIIYLAGYVMEQLAYRSKWYKRAVLSCIVVSPCLLEDYSMLMSESLFIVLLLLFLIAIHRYIQSHSRKMLVAAALLASLASVTRYAGITIIATGGLLLLLDTTLSLRRKIIDILLYALISPALLAVNLARNYSVSGTLTGGRESSITSLSENMHDAGSVFYDWLPFLHGHYKGAGWLFIVVITALAFLCVRSLLRYRRLSGYEQIAALFSLIYLLFMVITASLSRFETLDSRFLSPVFIFLLWTLSNWMVEAYRDGRHVTKRWLPIVGLIVFLLFQYGQLSADAETWDGVKDAGIPGYTEDQWRNSETVLFIQKDSLPFKKDYPIFSDADDAIYFFTGKRGKFLPHKEYEPGIAEFLADRHCYVVWFDDGENPDLVDKDFILTIKKMKLLKQFSDGAIYGYDQ